MFKSLKRIFFLTLLLSSTGLISACAARRPPVPPGTVPEQHELLSEDEQYGHEVMNQLTESYPVDRNDDRINRVRDIVDRLTKAAHADHNPWHVYVLTGDEVKNAAATRGNFIFVWTGMLMTTQSDGELATILAHEIGHVLAGHTAADPTEEAQKIISGIAGVAASSVLSSRGLGGPVADLAEMLVRISLEALLVNPESKEDELEADHIGLFMMSDAAYDPNEALNFWDRVQSDPNFGSSPLEFMSSHPSSSERLEALRGMIDEARERYRIAQGGAPRPVAPKQDGDIFRAAASSGSRSTAASGLGSDPRPIGNETWIVQENEVLVHKDPDSRSEVIERLALNSKVNVRSIRGRWLEITDPISGFVQSNQLAPRN